MQSKEFLSQFDSSTIAYDAFYIERTQQFLVIGPPLLNLESTFAAARAITLPDRADHELLLHRMDRMCRMVVKLQRKPEAIAIVTPLAECVFPLIDSNEELFSHRRVLVTLSKDNHLRWIGDWIRFHRDNHGADAVLLYDNNSQSYRVEQLAESIAEISGIKAACVVRWPYKYGPQGIGVSYWDSDFCQSGALEDARWRFLQKARSVLNVDIDELVMTSGRSIFEIVESEGSGYVAFRGRWVVDVGNNGGILASRSEIPTHRDFRHILKPQLRLKHWKGLKVLPTLVNRCPRKWAAVPCCQTDHSQWQVHRIRGVENSRRVRADVEYRHFKPISTNWHYNRDNAEELSPKRHIEDSRMCTRLNGVNWYD